MKNILVPIDFSTNSNSAIRYALSFANDVKAKLVFFHCSDSSIPTAGTNEAYRYAVTDDIRRKERLLTKKLTEICGDLSIAPTLLRVDYIVRHGGSVASHIIQIISEEAIDLIIMSTRGAAGIKKIFVGSVTSKVIRKSPVAVFAIPVKYKYQKIQKIVYSSDLKDFRNELSQVLSFAKLTKSRVEVLSLNHSAPLTDSERGEYEKAGVSFTVRMIDERPLADHLRAYLKDKRGHILVMFTHSGSRLEKFFVGSHTEEIAMDLHFPLLAIHKQRVADDT